MLPRPPSWSPPPRSCLRRFHAPAGGQILFQMQDPLLGQSRPQPAGSLARVAHILGNARLWSPRRLAGERHWGLCNHERSTSVAAGGRSPSARTGRRLSLRPARAHRPRTARARSPPTFPSSPRSTRICSGSPSRPPTARSTPPATRSMPSPSSRSRRPSSTATPSPNTGARLRARPCRRRADRRGLQFDRPRRGPQPSVQPDGQCRRHGDGGADQGRHGRGPHHASCSRSSRSSPAGACTVDESRLPLRAGDRPPQPRHRLHDAQHRHDPHARRSRSSTSISASARCGSPARDLAVMAATLANDGINPVTGEQALPKPSTSRTSSR